MDNIKLEAITRPGEPIDLVLSVDLVQDRIDVRPSVVLDRDGDRTLTVAQTSPPTPRSKVGEEIEASFLVRSGADRVPRRWGYQTSLLGLVPASRPSPGGPGEALVIGFPREGLQETSVRLHYRVCPAQKHGIGLRFPLDQEAVCYLIDISLGGLLLSMESGGPLERGQRVSLILDLKEGSLPLTAEVVRTFEKEGSKLLYAGFRFLDLDPAAGRMIQEAVNLIMRDELKSRSRMGERTSFYPG